MTDFQIYLALASGFYLSLALVGEYFDRKRWQ